MHFQNFDEKTVKPRQLKSFYVISGARGKYRVGISVIDVFFFFLRWNVTEKCLQSMTHASQPFKVAYF